MSHVLYKDRDRLVGGELVEGGERPPVTLRAWNNSISKMKDGNEPRFTLVKHVRPVPVKNKKGDVVGTDWQEIEAPAAEPTAEPAQKKSAQPADEPKPERD